MTTLLLEDQPGGISLVPRDQDEPPYYPAATVGAARVEIWTRPKTQGVDAAVKAGEFKPGSNFDLSGIAGLSAQDILFATVSYSAANVPSVSDLNHAEWQELNYTPTIAVPEISVETAVEVAGEQVIGPREPAVAHVAAGTGSAVSGSASATYDPTTQALIDSLKAQVNTLTTAVGDLKAAQNTTLSRLESHGLIDT